jgi:sarcosine oxidase subunit alpha
MSDLLTIHINGTAIKVAEGTTVAAALLNANIQTFRYSVTGEQRAPLCGMGICYECRVTINGQMHARSCQIPCENGMQVVSGK